MLRQWTYFFASDSSGIRQCLDQMTERVNGDGGAIAIDSQGKLSIDWNSRRMSWAYAIIDLDDDDKTITRKNDSSIVKFTIHFGCNPNEDFTSEETLVIS